MTDSREIETLPSQLANAIADFIATSGADFEDAAAMTSECETWSRRLAAALNGIEILDDDGDCCADCAAYPTQVWTRRVPEALADNELARGHWVCRVEWDADTYDIDMTAAQFPAMGWTGPVVH